MNGRTDPGAPNSVAWVIGARGLLGSAVARRIDADPRRARIPAPSLPWDEPDALATAARAAAESAVRISDVDGVPIEILWCGGRGVTSSSEEHFAGELDQLRTVLDAVGPVLTGRDRDDVIAYASSAGGVYGGSPAPPHSESTPPVPLAPYGRAKLAAEDEVRSFAQRTGASSFVARISNLYGPGQSLAKPQGLISHLARSRFSGRPLSIFMPLDTVRDYLYVEDAAASLLDAVERTAAIARADGRLDALKIVASGMPATIGEVLGTLHRVARTRTPVTLGRSAEAELQALDLRLRSEVWTDLDRRERTPLAVGIAATLADVLSRTADLARRG